MKGKRGRRKAAIAVSAVLLALLVSAGFLILQNPVRRKDNGIQQLYFSAGDAFAGYEVAAFDGTMTDVADLIKTPALVIFGMKGCRDCIADFPSYQILYGLYHREDFPILFIWDDEVPREDLAELGIPETASYSAKDNYKFTDWVPSYFLIGGDGVILETTTELSVAIDFLPEHTVSAGQFQRFSGGKQVLVGIERCGSCKKAFETIKSAGEEFLYYIEGASGGAEQDTEKIYDSHEILAKVFGIEQFPVLIDVGGDGLLRIDDDFS